MPLTVISGTESAVPCSTCSDTPPVCSCAPTRSRTPQGSTSIGHWAINLNIEPVPFEDAALGVRVHRGVYETAIQLYDELLPLVRQHLASSPDARVALGGHSLGGSVAAVIMLLLVCRAGVPPERLAPSYAFGAPAVFCAAGAGGCPHPGSSSSPPPPSAPASTPASPTSAASVSATSSLDHCGACAASRAANLGAAASHGAPPAPCSARRSLMARFGIPESLLTNVVMHKDIVPRAFLCNYTVVVRTQRACNWLAAQREWLRNCTPPVIAIGAAFSSLTVFKAGTLVMLCRIVFVAGRLTGLCCLVPVLGAGGLPQALHALLQGSLHPVRQSRAQVPVHLHRHRSSAQVRVEGGRERKVVG